MMKLAIGAGVFVWLLAISLTVGFWVAVVYIVMHFVLKFW